MSLLDCCVLASRGVGNGRARLIADASWIVQIYPKAKLDYLTNGIFAVAMTLLVLELRLPEQAMPDTTVLFQALGTRRPRA
jgi:hypothetical protein